MVHNTKKTKKFSLRGLFHPSPHPAKEKSKEISISMLKKLATTQEQEHIVDRIENETIPSVRDAWIEYFFKIIKHPQYKDK